MIAFDFTVNHSFLSRASHPITVPKSQVSYARLEAQHLGSRLVLIEPSGSRLAARLYSNTAGWGDYYQILVDGYASDPLYLLPMGTRLRIEIQRTTASEVRLQVKQWGPVKMG
jgi:hypothetical protein